jgi:hypothetical protein
MHISGCKRPKSICRNDITCPFSDRDYTPAYFRIFDLFVSNGASCPHTSKGIIRYKNLLQIFDGGEPYSE